VKNQIVTIRQATIKDAAIIALLGRITFTETFNHLFDDRNDLLVYYNRTFSVAKIRNSLKNKNNVFWLALVDELPVGYAKLKLKSNSAFNTSDKIGQLQKIYVLHDFISTGIGKKLKNTLVNTAKSFGLATIWLTTLKYNNDHVINFYKKSDFKVDGVTHYEIGKLKSELLVMSANLM